MPGSNDSAAPLVLIVDDDEGICAAMSDLFRSVGIEARTFGTPGALFEAGVPSRPGCIVLDVRLPGVSGLELQTQLRAANVKMPIVFLTGYGDISMTVRAMKAGAVDFLTKPFRDQDLLDAVNSAIEKDRKRLAADVDQDRIQTLVASLTPREREVARAVANGKMNKQIAFELDIAEITVKLHRGNAMRKLQARSLAALIEMLKQVDP